MICHSCKREIVEASAYCYHCGTRQTAPQSPPAAIPKRLMRSRRDKKIAGVCAGLADYFEFDVTLIRIVWLLVVFLGGTGLLAYLVCWIVMPLAPEPASAPLPATRSS
ncbi:MAG: PspC domain-containing protein [Terriglobia bacterium]